MSDAEPRNPFARRGFILGAVVVGGLTAAAIVLAVTTSPASSSTPGGTAAITAPPSTSLAADPAAASVCSLPGYETTNTMDVPPVADWSIVGTVAVPHLGDVGPGVIGVDGFRSCYAHTVEGALFSAVSFVAMSSDARTAARLSEMVAPGPGRVAAVKDTDPNAVPSSARLQLAGYAISSYAADEATIDLVWQATSNGGQLVSLPMAMRWVEGDWKVQLADNGRPVFTASPLQSLGGYTPWSGV